MNKGSVWKITRKPKSWTSLNFYVYARPVIHHLYFIYARKIYVRSHVKITRQWKSTLTGLIAEEPDMKHYKVPPQILFYNKNTSSQCKAV